MLSFYIVSIRDAIIKTVDEKKMKKRKIENQTKHASLTMQLRNELKNGDFANGKFLTVRKIMDAWEVSQATVSRALEPLFSEGLLYSVSGKGIFVASGKCADSSPAQKSKRKMLYYIISDSDIFSPTANPTDWFVSKDIMEGVTSEAFLRGYKMNIMPLAPGDVDINYFADIVDSTDSTFVFSQYQQYEPLIQLCINRKIPYSVYTWHNKINRKINQVWVDLEEGSHRIAEYIISLGHRNIAFFGGGKSSRRYKGHVRALKTSGLKGLKKFDMLGVSGSIDEAEKAARTLLEGFPEITAIACFSDLRAIGVINAARKIGLRVPEDISITGIDDISELYPTNPPLTTARLPRKETGKMLVKLADKMRGNLDSRPETIKLLPELIKRKSCKNKIRLT